MSVEIWQAADLNSSATGGAAAASAPVPYLTDFANQGPTARVVYQGTDGHIWELYYVGSDAHWWYADLNKFATGGAAAASAPVPYLTDFANQGPTARVVYLGIDNHIWELYYIGSEAKWGVADLNAAAGGGAAAASAPVPYLTDFADQGPTARVLYLGTGHDIWELSYIGSEAKWVATDLNGAAGGEAAAAWPAPVPYLTDFANQGPTARVLYLGTDNHIWELYYVGSTARWEPADLYWAAFPHAAPATAAPVAYLTDFANQGPTARVVYQAEGQNVLELAYAGAQSGALVVQKGAGMQVTSNAATLAGDVNAGGAPAAYFFEYGTTTTYGNVAPSPPPAVITTLPGMFSSANQAISGLQPATTYHFRLAAKYAQVPGQDWTYGADASFRTAGPPPPVVVPALVGQTLANALNVLQRLGFSLAGTIINETPNQIQNTLLKVVSQSPQQGTRVAPGTAVNLVVTAINTTIQGYSQIEVDNANDDGQPVDIYLINLATNVSQKVGTVQFNQQATYTLQNGVEYEIVAVDVTLENCPGSDPTILSCQKTLTYAAVSKAVRLCPSPCCSPLLDLLSAPRAPVK